MFHRVDVCQVGLHTPLCFRRAAHEDLIALGYEIAVGRHDDPLGAAHQHERHAGEKLLAVRGVAQEIVCAERAAARQIVDDGRRV